MFRILRSAVRAARPVSRRGFAKSPYETLGLEAQGLTLDQLNKRYLELIKKYHPDVSKDPDAQRKFIEVRKAYDQLKSTARSDGVVQEQQWNEQKPGSSGPSSWAPGSNKDHYFYSSVFYPQDDQPQPAKSEANRYISLAVVLGLVCGGFALVALFFNVHRKDSQQQAAEERRPKITQEQIDKCREKGWEREHRLIQAKIDKIREELPAKILNHAKETPHAMDLLLDYTIWKDIKVYFSTSSNLKNESPPAARRQLDLNRVRIDNVRLSEMITFAVEAERAFQHVFVDM